MLRHLYKSWTWATASPYLSEYRESGADCNQKGSVCLVSSCSSKVALSYSETAFFSSCKQSPQSEKGPQVSCCFNNEWKLLVFSVSLCFRCTISRFVCLHWHLICIKTYSGKDHLYDMNQTFLENSPPQTGEFFHKCYYVPLLLNTSAPFLPVHSGQDCLPWWQQSGFAGLSSGGWSLASPGGADKPQEFK